MAGNVQRDPVLGLIDNASIERAVFDHMKGMDDAHIVVGDFINLQNVNSALDPELTNQFMQVVVGIYQKELQGLNPPVMYGFRQSFGDELSFVVQGVDASDLSAALVRANQEVDTFVEDTGLNDLGHHKYEGITGAGLHVLTEPLSPDLEHHAFLSSVHDCIKDEKKSQEPSESSLEVRDFWTNGKLEQAQSAILSDPWQDFRVSETDVPKGMQFNQASVPDSTLNWKNRTDRGADLMELSKNPSEHSLVRFDIYNLGGLNSHLEQSGANEVRDRLFAIVNDELRAAYGDNAVIYDVAGGVIDATVPSQNADELNALKARIHERSYFEVLALPSNTFLAGADETPVGEIEYKDGNGFGAGLVMVDTPIRESIFPAALFERIDFITEIHKIYGVSYLQVQGETITGYVIGSDDTFQIENLEREADNAFPFSNSLKSRLTSDQMSSLFMKPVGLIAQQVFGLDVSEVLERQTAMKHLIAQGVDERDILNNVRSMDEFDTWLDETYPHHNAGALNILGRTNTHVRIDQSLMTMNLSTHWGYMVEGLNEAIVSTQLASRSYTELYREGMTPSAEDSIDFLAKDVRTGFEREPDLLTRELQLIHEATRSLTHVSHIQGESFVGSDAHTTLAAALNHSMEAVVSRLKDIEEPEVATAFLGVRQELNAKLHKGVDHSLSAVRSHLNEAAAFISSHAEVDPDQQAAIMSNFNGLNTVIDSLQGKQNHLVPGGSAKVAKANASI